MTRAQGVQQLVLCPRTAVVALLVATAVASVPQNASAQVNVESLRPDDLPFGRSGTISGDLAARSGNVDFVALDLSARLYDVREGSTRLVVGSGGIGFLDKSRFASAGLLHYRVTYTSLHPNVSPEWFGQINYDRPLLLNFRMVGGGGVHGSFDDGSWGDFGGGSALMLEQEWLSLPDTAAHPDQTLALRWSNYLSVRVLVSETTVITSTSYIQPELGAFNDFRVLENFRLSTKITNELALTVSFDLRYDSRPPDGLDALDARLRTGITYSY